MNKSNRLQTYEKNISKIILRDCCIVYENQHHEGHETLMKVNPSHRFPSQKTTKQSHPPR